MSLAPEMSPEVFQPRSLGYYVWKLMRLRGVMAWSVFKHAKRSRKFWTIVGYLLIGGFVGLLFWGSWQILGFLRSDNLQAMIGAQQMNALLEGVPIFVLLSTFAGILITSFGLLLQGLYLSGDMDFLISAPLPMRAVFVTKLLQAILPTFGLTVAFGLPVLFGLGIVQHYTWFYYPLVLVQMALIALTAAGISALLVMGVVRIFPARRVAEALAFVGAIFSMLCSQSGNLISSSAQDMPVDVLRTEQLNSVLAWATGANPLTWPGLSLVQIGRGEWLGFGLLLVTASVSLAIFGLSLRTAETLYYTGWASMQISVRKKKAPAAAYVAPAGSNRWLRYAEHLLSPAVRSIIWKDLLVIRRDLRNLSQIIAPVIIGLMYTFLLLRDSGDALDGQGMAPDWFTSSLPVWSSLGLSLIVSWSLLSRLALAGFSQEGSSYWLLKTAPVSNRSLVAAKFLFAYLPSLALAWVFVLLVTLMQGAGVATLPFTLLTMALWLAGLAGLNLGFGIRSTRLDWTEARQMVGNAVGCLSSLVSMVYMLLGGLFFLGPPLLAGFLHFSPWLGMGTGLMLGGGFSLACTIIPLWLGLRYVDRLGEQA